MVVSRVSVEIGSEKENPWAGGQRRGRERNTVGKRDRGRCRQACEQTLMGSFPSLSVTVTGTTSEPLGSAKSSCFCSCRSDEVSEEQAQCNAPVPGISVH